MQMLDSRVNSRGAASNTRRPSHSIWSPASSKRPVLTKLGSPESNKRPSIVSRHTANSHLEEPNLTDAINCQTIPKLVQEMQARRDEKGVGTNSSSRRAEGTPTNSNLQGVQSSFRSNLADQMKNAIPIHLHVQKAGEEGRTEFSPFSLHMNANVKDSLHAQSSHDQTHYQSRVDEDGTCTIRAESHLEATGLLQNTLHHQKSSAKATAKEANSQKTGGKLGKTESSMMKRPTKIMLVAPKRKETYETRN